MARRERDFIGHKPLERGRFYAPYDSTEEYHAGMWRTVASEAEQNRLMALSVSLLRDSARFGAALDRVLAEWPVSCRQEFTRCGNQCAWFGQAACCLDHGAPESLVRRAWWKLTEAERAEADRVAESRIAKWRARHSGPTRNREAQGLIHMFVTWGMS